MKYRQHRGTLEDSMSTVTEVNNIEDIDKIINESYIDFGKKVEEIEIKFYGYDSRINWETYIVTYRLSGEEQFHVAGMMDGNFK